MYWDELNNRAQKAAQLLGFNKEIWDGDDDNVPIYSTPFDELTEEKIEAVLYLGLRSYFAGWKANQCEEGEKELTYLMSYPDVKDAIGAGSFESGWDHYIQSGRKEGRLWQCP